ncbi:MAG: diguanylate cyclase [Thermoleophilia bacterium]
MAARAYPGERGRRPWFQLEGRHTGLLAGRLAAIAVVAGAALVVPDSTLAHDTRQALLASAAAALLQAVLWLFPRRYPMRLRLAVDLSLAGDAAWAGAMVAAAGGPGSGVEALFLVTSLWAALGYSARTGLKAAALSTLAFVYLRYDQEGDPWTAASIGRLAFFWGVLAAAIIGAAAGERELRVRAERLSVLHGAAAALLQAREPEAMLAAARAACERLAPGWRVSVRLGAAPDEVRLTRAGGEGVVVVPVPADERPVGAIECRRALVPGRRRHRIRLRDLSAIETLAAGLGSALWRAQLMERIERQSLTDGLTGLGNRRAFDEELARRLAEASRSGRPLSLCLLDIDKFKSYNDTFGHRAGDDALSAVAGTITASCRAADIACRYGGEEMAVLLPDTRLADAAEVAERLRRAVEAIPMEHRPVTVSIGVAATVGDCSAELLIEAADRALYAAKEGGRNRVVSGSANVVGETLAPSEGA